MEAEPPRIPLVKATRLPETRPQTSIHIYGKVFMAEAVGLVGSIAGLASLALSIVSALYKYGGDVKSAPARSEELRKELSELQTLCKVVEDDSLRVTTDGLPE